MIRVEFKTLVKCSIKIQNSEAQLLVRKPASAVFEALTNPEITTQTWEWEMYNVSTTIKILEIILNEKIRFEWGEPRRIATFSLKDLGENQTYVLVKETGYTESGDALLSIPQLNRRIYDRLDGMKAYLEHGLKLNLIADKFPSGK
ncbi:SRPBCC family protein [Flavobacterium noncentrifugens]|uniref:polyketide cyclase n=1 Tax=Flavobacterium noncentrifugens TaxID=1128970 RepID=UPI001C31A912|nr:polyketide cyclase [Flavobacterium noncentrifugens]